VQSDVVCEVSVSGSEPSLDAQLAPDQTLTALVADDSTLNRRILGDLLESAGFRVVRATGGHEAIRLVHEHRPDVVLMDLRMPDLDGLEATRRLRSDPATAHIPVIAVTASALGDAPAAAREAGCVDYIPKPIRAQALFAALQNHLHVRFIARPKQPSASAAPELDPARRLIIASGIRQAADVGDVTAVETLVAEMTANGAEAAVAQRIQHLAAAFDFDALRALADELSAETAHAGT
jgi:CheY-like chemotaxis protein